MTSPEPNAPADDGRVPRERDAAGRARNARPRDGLGRPLPRGSAGVPTTPEDTVLSPAASLQEAELLLADGRPFHAHEVLEAAWKASDDGTRELWKGLAQLAVGITHIRRGNRVGAARLLTRAANRIEPYAATAPHGIAVADLTAQARSLIAQLEQDNDAIPEAELAPRLLGPDPTRVAAPPSIAPVAPRPTAR